MVYSQKFVLSILVNGQPQKELGNGTVKIPFGEYAVRMRNKNSRRAVAQIYIDGENVSGAGYIIPANDAIDIKRWSEVDKAFKFVPLDSGEAVDFGKNGPNDDKIKGVVEVRFFLEKETPKIEHHYHHYHHNYYDRYKRSPMPYIPNEPIWMAGGGTYNCDTTSSKSLRCNVNTPESAALSMNFMPPVNDGCTVQGSSTNQSFTSKHIDIENDYVSLKVFLQGFEQKKPVEVVRQTNHQRQLTTLEQENEELRRKIAELENEKLKKQLESLK